MVWHFTRSLFILFGSKLKWLGAIQEADPHKWEHSMWSPSSHCTLSRLSNAILCAYTSTVVESSWVLWRCTYAPVDPYKMQFLRYDIVSDSNSRSWACMTSNTDENPLEHWKTIKFGILFFFQHVTAVYVYTINFILSYLAQISSLYYLSYTSFRVSANSLLLSSFSARSFSSSLEWIRQCTVIHRLNKLWWCLIM